MEYLKKYNESKLSERSTLSFNNLSMFKEKDFQEVIDGGKKVFVVDGDYKLVEVEKYNDIRKYSDPRRTNKYVFDYFLFIKINIIDKVQKNLELISELESEMKKEIKLRLDTVLWQVQQK
jgi:hypothetical protein